MVIREIKIEDYDAVLSLWQSDRSMYLDERDSLENIQKYLERNPGMSFVADEGSEIIGAILGGHDGRNAEIHHLIVDPKKQNQGIGRKLVESCLNALVREEIKYVNIFIKEDNHSAPLFWKHLGFNKKGAICYCLPLPSLLIEEARSSSKYVESVLHRQTDR